MLNTTSEPSILIAADKLRLRLYRHHNIFVTDLYFRVKKSPTEYYTDTNGRRLTLSEKIPDNTATARHFAFIVSLNTNEIYCQGVCDYESRHRGIALLFKIKENDIHFAGEFILKGNGSLIYYCDLTGTYYKSMYLNLFKRIADKSGLPSDEVTIKRERVIQYLQALHVFQQQRPIDVCIWERLFSLYSGNQVIYANVKEKITDTKGTRIVVTEKRGISIFYDKRGRLYPKDAIVGNRIYCTQPLSKDEIDILYCLWQELFPNTPLSLQVKNKQALLPALESDLKYNDEHGVIISSAGTEKPEKVANRYRDSMPLPEEDLTLPAIKPPLSNKNITSPRMLINTVNMLCEQGELTTASALVASYRSQRGNQVLALTRNTVVQQCTEIIDRHRFEVLRSNATTPKHGSQS